MDNRGWVMWVAASVAICFGLYTIKDPVCLWGFVFPLVASLWVN